MNPSLSFYYYPLANCVNGEFLFDVFHSGAEKITWDLGDGTKYDADLQMPHVFHAYSNPGIYTVDILATNQCGSARRMVYPRVVAGPNVNFAFEDKTYLPWDTVFFENTSTGYTNHLWYFNEDENDTSTLDKPYRVYPNKGTFKVMLLATNEYDCYDTISKNVVIRDNSNVDNIVGEGSIKYYPNPTDGLLTVEAKYLVGSGKVEIRDINGKLLISKPLEANTSRVTLNLIGLTNGVYTVRVVGNEYLYSGKVMIRR